MICKNKNNILRFTINETKFRHCRCNWVYKRRFVSGIRELAVRQKPNSKNINLINYKWDNTKQTQQILKISA
jgi:hypothetical protein